MYLILTFDVESNMGEKEITHDLPRTLDILSAFPKIKCTFNVAAHAINISKKNIREILDNSHEIAAHGYKHDMNWNVKPLDEQEKLIIKAKSLLESELETKIVGWATPRGNEHHANIGLLKKYEFLYVRDKSYLNYYQFIPPKVHSDGFVELPRFGYDECGFMQRNTICSFLFNFSKIEKIPFCDIMKLYPDWTSDRIYEYFKNMYHYKKHVERSYLITNLHPARIGENKELEKAFVDFLELISNDKGVEIFRAKDFAKKLINREIDITNSTLMCNAVEVSSKNEDLTIIHRGTPDLALIFNSSMYGYTGKVVTNANFLQLLILKLLKTNIIKKYDLIYDWSKKKVKYDLDIKDRRVTLYMELPPYSTSKMGIGKARG
jgi:peptidoglycan/xylan/chitin deacetylase (PgdA/CDA1 family)